MRRNKTPVKLSVGKMHNLVVIVHSSTLSSVRETAGFLADLDRNLGHGFKMYPLGQLKVFVRLDEVICDPL